jgi:hypothetical protein
MKSKAVLLFILFKKSRFVRDDTPSGLLLNESEQVSVPILVLNYIGAEPSLFAITSKKPSVQTLKVEPLLIKVYRKKAESLLRQTE